MSNIIKFKADTSLEISQEQLRVLKSTIARECSDVELDLFLTFCKKMRIDPFLKHAYPVKRSGVMSIQIGIDGYRAMAERTGKYMPGKEATYTYSGDKLVSATAHIKKLGPDKQWHEISETAYMSEYESVGPLWKKMPHAMLKKCAESGALRKAFPSELGGVYTSEEMEQAIPVGHATDARVTFDQVLHLDSLFEEDLEYKKRVLDFFKIESFEELQADKFEKVLERFELRKNRDTVKTVAASIIKPKEEYNA